MESKVEESKQEKNVNIVKSSVKISEKTIVSTITADDSDEIVDDALDQLLDSAMDQFETLKVKNENDERQQQQQQQQESKQSSSFNEARYDEARDFLADFVDQDPKLKEQWTQLTESCQKAANAKTDEEFEESISETIKNLTENARNLAETSEITDEELSRIWGPEGPPETNEQFKAHADAMLPDMMPLIANMMQSLLSRDILYPALKDLIAKYPEWLSENKEKLNVDEYKRYNKQLDLMKSVCNEFDAECDNDSEETKSTRFQRILLIMQQMQQCGSPPKELVGEAEQGAFDGGEFDFTKLPGFPSSSNPSACCMM